MVTFCLAHVQKADKKSSGCRVEKSEKKTNLAKGKIISDIIWLLLKMY